MVGRLNRLPALAAQGNLDDRDLALKHPRFAHVGPCRGLRARVGQIPDLRAEIAPWGHVGQTTDQAEVETGAI
jgi:hypothetical protein